MDDTTALGDRICELADHLNAANCRLLDLIAEFDLHEGWARMEFQLVPAANPHQARLATS